VQLTKNVCGWFVCDWMAWPTAQCINSRKKGSHKFANSYRTSCCKLYVCIRTTYIINISRICCTTESKLNMHYSVDIIIHRTLVPSPDMLFCCAALPSLFVYTGFVQNYKFSGMCVLVNIMRPGLFEQRFNLTGYRSRSSTAAGVYEFTFSRGDCSISLCSPKYNTAPRITYTRAMIRMTAQPGREDCPKNSNNHFILIREFTSESSNRLLTNIIPGKGSTATQHLPFGIRFSGAKTQNH
jgi:hypothetical protein